MPNDYCTIEDIKRELPDAIPDNITDYDVLLEKAITSVSRYFDKETKWEPGAFAQSATDEDTRYYTGSGGSEQWIDPFVASPSLVAVSQGGGLASSDYTTYPSSDWFVSPYNAADIGEPYLSIELDTINGAYNTFYRYSKSVKITAPFGYSDTDNIPDAVVKAVVAQVAHWFGLSRQGFSDTGAIIDLGQLSYTKALHPIMTETIDLFKKVSI